MDITMKDLQRLSEIYNQIIHRGQELTNMERKIQKQYELDVMGIYEIDDNFISFNCEDAHGYGESMHFTFKQFLDEKLYQEQKKVYDAIMEEERIEKEKLVSESKAKTEKYEREMLAKLKEKYEKGDS